MKTSAVLLCLMLGLAIAAGPANSPVAPAMTTDANPNAVGRATGPFSTLDDPPTVEWTFNCEFVGVYNVGVTPVQDSLCWVSCGTDLLIGIYNIADPTHPFRSSFAQTGGPSGWGIRDMAYKQATDEVFAGFDGQRFHVYNATTHVPNNTYTVTGYSGTVRGMGYNPAQESLWTCNFTTSPMTKFSITGTNGHQVKAAAEMGSAYGIAWDAVQNCFWVSQAGAAGASPIWKMNPDYTIADSFLLPDFDLAGGCEKWRDTFLLVLEQATPDMIWCLRFPMGAPLAHDMGVSSILAPGSSVQQNPVAPKAQVRNFGANPESNIPVTCWIDSGATRVYTATGTVTGPVAPGATADFTFTPNWNPGPAGANYNVTMFTGLVGDLLPANDTMRGTTMVTGAMISDTIVVKRLADFGPAIDGVLSPGEWAASNQYDISDVMNRGGGGSQPRGTIYAYYLYDAAEGFMYFGMDYPTYTGHVDYDQFGPYLDENRSGTWSTDSSEGNYWCEYVGGVDDCTYRALLSTLPDIWLMGPTPGAAVMSSTSSGHLQYEAKIPFGTEKYQLTIQPGDTIGYFQYAQAGGAIKGWWPSTLSGGSWANPAFYGMMVFDPVPVGVETPQAGSQFSLYKATPSVVRNSARIGYYVGRQSNVDLGVYDVSGKLVKTLVQGTMAPGEQTATWNRTDNNGRRVSGGTYFYRLTVDGKAVSGKAVLLD